MAILWTWGYVMLCACVYSMFKSEKGQPSTTNKARKEKVPRYVFKRNVIEMSPFHPFPFAVVVYAYLAIGNAHHLPTYIYIYI